MIIHIHIARTAGCSLRDIFEKKYSRVFSRFHRQMCPPSNQKKGYDVVCGHIPFGTHKYFPSVKEYTYLTVLRDPIKRWISFFNKTMEFNKGGKLKRNWTCSQLWAKQSQQNIIQFLQHCIDKDVHSNIMVRQLSGIERWENIKQNPKNGRYAFLWCPRKEKTNNIEVMLEKAKDNLQNNIEHIAFQETFDKDVTLILSNFDINIDKIDRVNTASSVSAVSNLNINWQDKTISNLLFELNKYDMQLYEFARELKET